MNFQIGMSLIVIFIALISLYVIVYVTVLTHKNRIKKLEQDTFDLLSEILTLQEKNQKVDNGLDAILSTVNYSYNIMEGVLNNHADNIDKLQTKIDELEGYDEFYSDFEPSAPNDLN